MMVSASNGTEDWRKVHEAIADSRWDFRTVGGISRQTGLGQDRVRQLLKQHRSEVRQNLSGNREAVYTLASRPMKMREILANIQRFARNSL